MATASYQTQLEEVQAAISRVLQSQEYQVAGRSQKRALLSELTDREKFLRTMVNRETAGGIKFRRGVFKGG